MKAVQAWFRRWWWALVGVLVVVAMLFRRKSAGAPPSAARVAQKLHEADVDLALVKRLHGG